MIHSLVHIESVAMDLSWDIIARFTSENLPKEFYDDFVKVAQDEAKVKKNFWISQIILHFHFFILKSALYIIKK